MIPYVVTEDRINIVIDDNVISVMKKDVSYEKVKKLIQDGSDDIKDELLSLISVKNAIEKFACNSFAIENKKIIYDGNEISLDNLLIDRILSMKKEGFDVEILVKFFDNLINNPSAHAVRGLYKFLEKNSLPLTDDGCFLAYKRILHNYKDIYTNAIDNSVGKVVSMMRNQVDDDNNNTCSEGLHFAGYEYATKHYGSNNACDDRLIVVKINPADVVAFPDDYNCAKGRCCKYEVVKEIEFSDFNFLDSLSVINDISKAREVSSQVRKMIGTEVKDQNENLLNLIHKETLNKIINALEVYYNIELNFSKEFDNECLTMVDIVKKIFVEKDFSAQKTEDINE